MLVVYDLPDTGRGHRRTSRVELDHASRTLTKTQLAVDRAKRGDRDALRFLYMTYAENVYGYVRSIVRDDYEAEDLTQQVFAKLITTLVKYDDRGVPFFAWLLRLARNVAIDHLRADRLAPTDVLLPPDNGASPDMERTQIVKAALASLPAEQRQVVLLRHLFGLTPPEIARRMGRTESAINCLHHRGRRALQRELVRSESGPFTRPARQLAVA